MSACSTKIRPSKYVASEKSVTSGGIPQMEYIHLCQHVETWILEQFTKWQVGCIYFALGDLVYLPKILTEISAFKQYLFTTMLANCMIGWQNKTCIFKEAGKKDTSSHQWVLLLKGSLVNTGNLYFPVLWRSWSRNEALSNWFYFKLKCFKIKYNSIVEWSH